jgi:hypothetical protein
MSARHKPSAAARDARLALRAGTGLHQAWLEAAGAALSAQAVIGQRMGQMMAAGMGLRPADHAEMGRMGSEKVEAGLAAAPALLGGWLGMQMQLLRFWQREAMLAARLGSPAGSWRALEAAAARATTAGLRMTVANTAALAPVMAPWYGRVAANARRLSEAEARAAAKAPRRGRAKRAG